MLVYMFFELTYIKIKYLANMQKHKTKTPQIPKLMKMEPEVKDKGGRGDRMRGREEGQV